MKIFLDRLGFVFHRPRFWKLFTSIVAQGIYGGNNIAFNFIGNALGFNVVKGSYITTRELMTEQDQRKMTGQFERQSKRFYAQLIKNAYPTPSIFAGTILGCHACYVTPE